MHRRLLIALVVVAGVCLAQSATFTTLYSFRGGNDGANPFGGVVFGSQGVMYGTTVSGGSFGVGTAYKLSPPNNAGHNWTESVIHTFDWFNGTSSSDGEYPGSALTLGPSGVLYGTARAGGTPCCDGAGAVYQLTPSSTGEWTESTLYAFDPEIHSSNHTPWGSVLMGPNQTLYTTTTTGTAVAVTPPHQVGGSWTGYVLGTVGSYAEAGIVLRDGKLYGTTLYGGDHCNDGTCAGSVYELAPPTELHAPWTVTTIYNFGDPHFGGIGGDGNGSVAPLTVGNDGNLYGTSYTGGAGGPCQFPLFPGCGTVFQLLPPASPGGAWTENLLYNFSGQNGDGALPGGALYMDQTGALYGTTEYGGTGTCTDFGYANGCGIIFKLSPPSSPGGAWTETVLHSFSGENGEGAVPLAGLTMGPDGVFYGVTSIGGSAGLGTVFSLKLP